MGVTVVLIVALLVTGALQHYALMRHDKITGKQRGQAGVTGSALSGMDSFALALLLGGLRGPLVMILWTSSESAKQERDLEGVNTQIEWIRLLQPEFDTVHVFQIWNKAYNISVQMANLANKYTTILDALDYAHNVLNERPNNLTITSSVAGIYFDKLGNSTEKNYYRQRVRDESRPHKTLQRVGRNEAAWTRVALDPMLDDAGNILPKYLKATRAKPVAPTKNDEWNDGSELQYLAAYQPFAQGISPFALAYNYYKQAQVMQTVEGQRHIQSSDMVVDSRPALALKNWSEEEWERGRRFELTAFNVNVPMAADRTELELPASRMALGSAVNDAKALESAIQAYESGSKLTADAITEYERHLRGYSSGPNESTYSSHIIGLRAQGFLCAGDAAYLRALRLPAGTERDAFVVTSRENYKRAVEQYALITLKYYTDDVVIRATFPPGYYKVATATDQPIEKLPPDLYPQILVNSLTYIRAHAKGGDSYTEDREEYLRYTQRASDRLQNLN